jgi:NAD(P)-dependent dehydrogenase (short-subunit alcohol dehydrogenase family)
MAAGAQALGPVHAVVANAGIAGPTLPLHEITLADWRDTLATDLDGVFLTLRAFIPGMIERLGGSLIAISSMTGKRPLHGRTPYAAAKMGVIGLVRTLATELGPYNIRVNAVCPGPVAGPRMEDVVRKQAAIRGITEDQARAGADRGVAAGPDGGGRGGGRGVRVPRLGQLRGGHGRGPERHRRCRHVLSSREGDRCGSSTSRRTSTRE